MSHFEGVAKYQLASTEEPSARTTTSATLMSLLATSPAFALQLPVLEGFVRVVSSRVLKSTWQPLIVTVRFKARGAQTSKNTPSPANNEIAHRSLDMV